MSGVGHLYVHLPFCAARCGYCAFVVEVGALGRRDDYLGALEAELEAAARDGLIGPLETVYLGGGTPTLMRPRRIAALMERIRPWLAPDAEVSIEANPETVDGPALWELRRAGVNRLSLGVQSFQPHLLAALDRQATPAQARRLAHCARRAGFENLSMDLIFAIPGQSAADLEHDLEEALAAAPDHISWYELELKPGSALARSAIEPMDEDASADAYRRIVAGLEDAGYRWYETANFARPGRECRHSLAYWGAADYLGLGVGAVSTIAGERRRNAPGVEAYIAALASGAAPPRTREELDADDRRRERWMLGLRLQDGMPLAWSGPPDRADALERLAGAGLLRHDAERVTLTREGRFVQNAILHELMDYA